MRVLPHPDLGRGYPLTARWGPPPPMGVDGQVPVKTLPSPFLRNAGGKTGKETFVCVRSHCEQALRVYIKT